LRGCPPAVIADDLKDLPAIHISNETVALAIQAVDLIMESSDLKDCWEESDEYSSWKETVSDIRQRLSLA